MACINAHTRAGLHLDEAFAATTQFGRCIVHGMLLNGALSAVIAKQLPGEGTIYLQVSCS
jgi:acyl dehydratase